MGILSIVPPVCLPAVSSAELIPGELTTAYKSAFVQGRAVVVQDPEDKMYARKLRVQALDPVSMSRAVLCAEHSMQRTMLEKIVPETVTGKESFGD